MIGSLNVGCARSSYDVLARVADEDNMSVIEDGQDGDVLWAARRDDVFRFLLCVGPAQLLNRIPGMGVVCEKLATHAALASGRKLPFWPATWPYTGSKAELLSAKVFDELPSGASVIVKPSRTARGVGITIAHNSAELIKALRGIRQCLRESADGEQDLLRVTDDAILQQYLDEPLLLGGLKFDLRLYVLVCPADEQCQMMEELGPAFLCREGLARFCTKPYARIADSRSDWASAHLTNTSVSKNSSAFEKAADPDDGLRGSKRKVSSVLESLERSGALSVDAVWASIEVLVSTTLRRLAPAVYQAAVAKETYTTPPSPDVEWRRCVEAAPGRFAQAFSLLGFDVILDSRGEPFLLEVNAAPSLAMEDVVPIEGPFDGRTGCKRLASAACRPRWAAKHGGSDWGQLCRCPDMPGRHKHEPSAIDLAIKSVTVRGALQILQARARGQRQASWADGTSYTPLHGVPAKYL
mmetsp:Transcript_44767/g.90311  ORF Transcript_44767/g.90311 Transcript_44767/m.90311 type:complete len:468 (+) Transcript_44767:66-1469(+)